jgi:hypothetical protein
MLKIPIIIAVITAISFSGSIPQKFIDALIYDKPDIIEYINKDENTRSKRLGIVYNGVKNKSLIGFEIPEEIKTGIQNGKYKYEISEKPLEDSYIEVTFKVPEVNFTRTYYFKEGFVSNSAYVSRNWKKLESRYFFFRLQEPKYFNDYCIKRLDDFVDMVADTLGFTNSERRILEEQKIGYIFCESEKEVEEITGFKARGMALLGSDEVVTSYQTHFHEIAHILINYKLKNLRLYTLPFFMEGFAVAVGGRGGMAPRVVTDLGFYLQKTGFLTYDSIITNEQFYSQDANMTYAVSGLYNSFLLSELGGEKYLELYKSVNGDLEFVKKINSSDLNLPGFNLYKNNYLEKYENDLIFYVDVSDTLRQNEMHTPFVFKEDFAKFFIYKDILFGPDDEFYEKDLYSKKLQELLEIDKVSNQYCIICDSISVNVYNLYNDELIYSYICTLNINPVRVATIYGGCVFFLKKSLFGNTFKGEFHWIVK